jgi:hypothetical protein
MRFLFPSPGTLLAHTRSPDLVIVLGILPRRGRPKVKCLFVGYNQIREMDLVEGHWEVVSKLENGL